MKTAKKIAKSALALWMCLAVTLLFTNCKKENLDDIVNKLKGQKHIDGKGTTGTKDDNKGKTGDDKGKDKGTGTKGDDKGKTGNGTGKDKDPGGKGKDDNGNPGNKGDDKGKTGDGKGKDTKGKDDNGKPGNKGDDKGKTGDGKGKDTGTKGKDDNGTKGKGKGKDDPRNHKIKDTKPGERPKDKPKKTR